MISVPFTKVESIGNDFVLIEPSALPNMSEDVLRDFARVACERRFGIGSDGLLVAWPEDGRLKLRMFNPDGTEDFCGNGLRCAALYARTKGWLGDQFVIDHLHRSVPTQIFPSGCIRTEIGKASFKPQDVPLDECSGELFQSTLDLQDATLTVSAVTTGSTHTVIFVDELPPDREFRRLSGELEHHQIFPERTSVIWTQVAGDDHLHIRIWERGAGETLGCGTGSSAAAVVYMRKTGRGGNIVVTNPGGDVAVSAASWQDPVVVQSHARLLFEGAFLFTPKRPS